MAGTGHFAHKATDSLSEAATQVMRRGFAAKKTSAVIARQIREATGEVVNPRTVGRRAQEWRAAQQAIEDSKEEIRALVSAMKEGDVTSSEMIQALSMQALISDSAAFTKQNPLKLQSQNLRAEEISLKRQALALKQREVAVIEEKLRILQEREQKAAAIATELQQKAKRGASLTADDIARIREVYGLSA